MDSAKPTPRVLLVEDNPHALELYRYAIEKLARQRKQPMDVISVGDGREALGRLETERFDVVVTDLYMPILDGFELIERVRADARHADVRVLAISAGDPVDLGRAGADEVLRKPVRFDVFAESLAKLLGDA